MFSDDEDIVELSTGSDIGRAVFTAPKKTAFRIINGEHEGFTLVSSDYTSWYIDRNYVVVVKRTSDSKLFEVAYRHRYGEAGDAYDNSAIFYFNEVFEVKQEVTRYI